MIIPEFTDKDEVLEYAAQLIEEASLSLSRLKGYSWC